MLFRDRPLLARGIDEHLYLPRPALESAVTRPLLSGRNVLVLGEGGSGKSTLLRRVGADLEGDRPVAWVNAAPADDALSLLQLVDDALGEDDARRPIEDSLGLAGRLLSAARRLRRPASATVIVDGLSDGQIAYDVFGRLRDELWDTGHVWLVAVRPRDSASLRTPPADAFWGAIVEIPPLDQAEATALLQRGLDDDEFARVDRDRPIGGLYPRMLIRDAESRLIGPPSADRIVDNAELERRASEIGGSESMAMAEMLGLARPVSAHDPEFLERLGWSRPYAQRILSHLESVGLARSFPERDSDRSGRPRKLYEPNRESQ